VSAPGSPYKTFADAIDSKSTFTAIDDSGGSDEQLRVLFGAYQAKAHILSGYSDAGSVVQGFLRGDGPITQQSFSDLQGAIDGGKAVPLLLNAPYPAGAPDYDKLKNVPTAQSFLDENKPATADGQKAVQALADQFTNTSPNQVVFAAPGTPADVAAALQQAFKQALGEASVQAAFNKAGLTPGYIDPAATLAHIKDVIAGAPAIRKYLDYSYSGS
jgi:tripartite-type tricarboxylate transporter receptor subunit TctC